MNYAEIDALIKSEERSEKALTKRIPMCDTLEDKIALQREIKGVKQYIQWLRANFYAISDGQILLTDYKKQTV